MKTMKRIPIHFIAVAICAFLCISPVQAATSPPPAGGVLPDINLTVPQKSEHRSYLGLSSSGIFKIPDIKTKMILVEIFSMYCPHCQGDAPIVNELYRMIEDSPNLKGQIKLIGIGAGNSSYEVEVFRKTYDIPFPLFEDRDFSIHKVLGEVRTPYFIGVKINDDGTHQVFYSKLGSINEADQFLKVILQLSGLTQGSTE